MRVGGIVDGSIMLCLCRSHARRDFYRAAAGRNEDAALMIGWRDEWLEKLRPYSISTSCGWRASPAKTVRVKTSPRPSTGA